MASNGDADLDGLYSSDEDEWQEKNIRCLVRTRSVEDCLAPLIVQVRERLLEKVLISKSVTNSSSTNDVVYMLP